MKSEKGKNIENDNIIVIKETLFFESYEDYNQYRFFMQAMSNYRHLYCNILIFNKFSYNMLLYKFCFKYYFIQRDCLFILNFGKQNNHYYIIKKWFVINLEQRVLLKNCNSIFNL